MLSSPRPHLEFSTAKMQLQLAISATLFCSSIAAPAPKPRAPSLKILQSNDDGWAEANARALFDRLTTAGHDVILSAPSVDRSGTGSYPS
jgi:hypothetical protein